MSIKYYLLENKLTPDPRDQRAQVIANGNKTMDDIIDEAMEKGTLVTRTDMVAVSHLLFEVLCRFAAQGYNVHTPFCKVRPSVRGAFASRTATFNPAEHEIRVSFTPGKLMREHLRKATVEKVEGGANQPLLVELHDKESDSLSDEITPGSMAVLQGARLVFDASKADEGLFFLDSSGVESKVAQTGRSTATEIIFNVPPGLATGDYTLVMRSRMGTMLMKEGKLQSPLEVK